MVIFNFLELTPKTTPEKNVLIQKQHGKSNSTQLFQDWHPPHRPINIK